MKVLAIIFNGFEEEEAMAPFVLLRRAGIDLTIASTADKVTGSHDITLANITLLKDINLNDFDSLLIPGGPHWKFLKESTMVHQIIKHFYDNNKVISCICAAPTILGHLGYLKNKSYTCFTPLNEDFGGNYTNAGVTVDGNIISAKSVAYSVDFAYAIVEKLLGKEALKKLYTSILYEKE